MSTALRTYFRGHSQVSMEYGALREKRFYHFDNRGTTQCLTDSTGATSSRFCSDAWGVPTSRTGTDINRHWYIGNLGYYSGPDMDAPYVRARWYRPDTALWMSVDPVYSADRHYIYSDNNPAQLSDPSGLLPTLPWPSHWCKNNERQCTRITRDVALVSEYRRRPGSPMGPNVSWQLIPEYSKRYPLQGPGSRPGSCKAGDDCRLVCSTYRVVEMKQWQAMDLAGGWKLETEICLIHLSDSCNGPEYNLREGALDLIGLFPGAKTAVTIVKTLGRWSTNANGCQRNTASLPAGRVIEKPHGNVFCSFSHTEVGSERYCCLCDVAGS